MTDRTPPHDLDAEMAVLGGMLLSKHAIAEAAETLDGGEFYKPAHEQIFTAILGLYADGQPADPVTVSAELARRGDLARVGGAPYLHTLMGCIPTAANAGWYAAIVREHAVRRRIIEAGTRIAQMGWETDDATDLAAIIDAAQAETHALGTPPDEQDAPTNPDVFDQMLEDIENGVESGVPTGFADLDRLTRGLHPGQLVVAAARERVVTAPLMIDDATDLTLMRVRTKARRLKQRHNLRLIIVDYLQLMSAGGARKHENRQTEVAALSRGLKLLAKELHVPVVVLAQLNRGPEQRGDKRPMLSDLRESGAIEQDADVVILLHREDAYNTETPRRGEADLIVAKHRNGPTATITVAFQGSYSRFVDMADTWSPSSVLAGNR